ncbi:response regulator [Flavisphingopyxis soli]|nr:response regulator transcription factor [Sphingorhabdus soli]
MSSIVLADDHPFIRSAVSQVLELAGHSIAACVANGDEALAAVAEHRPDIVILDVKMPGRDGIEVLSAMHADGDTTPVVLLTAGLTDEQLIEALRCNVRGIVFKDGAEDRLVECLEAVAAGRRFVDQELLNQALAESLKPPPADPLSCLAPREREIAGYVGKGLRNREIGDAMGITEGTVKVYLNSIYNKLYLRNRTALALIVMAP